MIEVFPGVFKHGNHLFTRNRVKGKRVYGEKLVVVRGVEYREWNPYRSKLAAAILNGLSVMPITHNSNVLYLGAAQGTTVSHVSDIVVDGYIVAVEISPKAMEDFLLLAKRRDNIIPILGDANKPEMYEEYLDDINVIYQDVAQPNQTEILSKNARYLKHGYTMLCVKSRSIDVVKNPKKVFRESVSQLEASGLKTEQVVDLEPYEKDHAMIISHKD